ncbi:GNAT family N-acetyltransferase [Hyphomonas sp.]|uniref:GNAT family N-acetyltransferase n=1 Tax=Hyphomonas sp. TaxID=87 RepID=UPI0039195B1C
MTSIRVLPLTSSRTRAFREAYAIYETAIPRGEQKTRAQIVAGLKHPGFRYWAFEYEGEIAGIAILYTSEAEQVLLLEYLAISPGLQGKGLGSQLFRAAFEASRTDPRMLLLIEVDSENDRISEKEKRIRLSRKQFYRRLGCLEAEGFNYILPLENYGPPPRMSLLVLGARGNTVDTSRLRRALQDIYVNVYKCDPSDPRLDRMFEGHRRSIRLV